MVMSVHINNPQLDHRLASTQEQLDQAVARITAIDSSMLGVERELDNKATVTDVRQCVTRIHYEQAVTALGQDLATKTPVTVSDDLREKLKVCDYCLLLLNARREIWNDICK